MLCVTYSLLHKDGVAMNKKILVVIIILAIGLLIYAFPINLFAQDFEGHFTMNVPMGKQYRDVAYCLPNGDLSSAAEYWEVNTDCEIDDGEIVVYYFNNSILSDGESNALQHALNGLTTSYMYQQASNDGNLIVLTNDIDMKGLPPYLAGKSNEDGSEAVFVGGRNLNDVKNYANTIEFLN